MSYVLITGASSGIGKAIAYEFAKNNHSLLLVARRKQLLKQIQEDIQSKYDVDVKILSCDLTKNVDDVFSYVKNKHLDIEILINNAGFGDYGEFINEDKNKALEMIELNNKSLVSLTYDYLQLIDKGHIINVGSVASFMPGPYMSLYYASKSFVLSFSLALRQELKNKNIKVSVLCPGPTKSQFFDIAGIETSKTYDLFSRTCEQVACTCFKLYIKNKPYIVDGLVYKIGVFFVRILPLSLSSKIIGFVQSKTKSNN